MIPHHVYYQLAILGLLWFCIMLHYLWPSQGAVASPAPAKPVLPTCKRERSKEPTPFAGLTQRPHCAACEHAANHPTPPPPRRPDPMPPPNRRPRAIDTSRHFCPHAGCDYQGWPGLGNLRANGHPSGGPWRQFHCMSCGGYVLETHGTIFHGKRASVDLIVRVIACLAEGLGIRATARVFEVDPNTVLHWLVEGAEQLQAFTSYFLCDVHVTQLQLDELYTVIRALKAGELSADDAIKRLEGTRPWVWTAMEPGSKLLLVIAVGPRTLEMAQRVVHQVVGVLAPGCVPAWFSDGFKGYLPAILGHYGVWVHPERRQDKGPGPKPRWMPLPGLLYAQVIKQYRRKRLVGVKHRVVFGTREAVQHVLAACGWQINTSFVERLNLDIRQRVAAVGRRVNTLCQGEDSLRQQLAVYQVYYNFCLPHASLRQPLLVPEPTNGSGSAKRWRPCTPTMAAGLSDHVWSLKEVLLYRVPPWPQPQV
jgi:transposase-like protein